MAVKVDREERPDVDAIYMSAVQVMTGRGGWPMTVWLTPERKPFYGGTYFPARDGDRGARRGFLTLLTVLEEVYRLQPDKVAQTSEQSTQVIEQILKPGPGGDLPDAALLETTVAGYRGRFDSRYGGLSGAPKFPSSLLVRLLLRHYRHGGDAAVPVMATTTLKNMAAGGMHDQVGGGFHRYSTDEHWLVPHFEKMLYDNALLAMAYLEAWQVTGDPAFKQVTVDILRYVQRDMTSSDGAFFSATDADSLTPAGHREEGWFFTWTPAEIDRLLDPQAARLVKAYYRVTDKGNFEGRNILHTPESLAAIAGSLEITEQTARALLDSARDTLYQARLQRPSPLRDENDATFDIKWLHQAITLDKALEEHFEDPSAGGFFMTADDHETLLTREKPAYDGAEPSGNSVALLNLMRLHEFTTDDRYRRRADKALKAFSGRLQSAPAALTEMLLALDFHLDKAKEIIIVTPEGEKQGANPATNNMLAQLRRTFLPNRIIVVVEEGKMLDRQASVIPLLKGKRALQGKTTAYVCEQGVCELPTRGYAAACCVATASAKRSCRC